MPQGQYVLGSLGQEGQLAGVHAEPVFCAPVVEVSW